MSRQVRKKDENASPTPRNTHADIREIFNAKALKITGRFVRFTQWATGAPDCPNGDSCAYGSFFVENLSDRAIHAAIRRGSTSIGACIGFEQNSSGLNLYGQPQTSYYSFYPDFQSAQQLVPPGAKIPITIKLVNCRNAGARTADISTALTVSDNGQLVEIPISATDVPIQN
jgi:hypothetical protein